MPNDAGRASTIGPSASLRFAASAVDRNSGNGAFIGQGFVQVSVQDLTAPDRSRRVLFLRKQRESRAADAQAACCAIGRDTDCRGTVCARNVAEVELQPRMDALAARVREETQIPGIVLGASVDGRRTYAAAGTSITGERRRLGKSATFALGCASKLPLAIRAHELARRGALGCATRSPRTCPRLHDSACGETVLCEHLLSHQRLPRHEHFRRPHARTRLGRLGGVFEGSAAAVRTGSRVQLRAHRVRAVVGNHPARRRNRTGRWTRSRL
jgi:hypothetical protein